MDEKKCPFCDVSNKIILENEYCFSMFDQYPVSPGHTLIISKRHISNYFELTDEEKNACWNLVEEVKTVLKEKYNPDGWNIGINCGSVAGQTVFHFHCHFIPRFKGDMENPEGGVRHSVEGMGYY